MLSSHFRAAPTPSHPLVVLVGSGAALGATGKALDKTSGGAISRAMGHAGFKGNAGKTLTLIGLPGITHSHLILVGVGEGKKITRKSLEEAGGHAVATAQGARVKQLDIVAELPAAGKLTAAELAAHLAFGAELRTYRFDKYRTTEKPEDKPTLAALAMVTAKPEAAKKIYAPLRALAGHWPIVDRMHTGLLAEAAAMQVSFLSHTWCTIAVVVLVFIFTHACTATPSPSWCLC